MSKESPADVYYRNFEDMMNRNLEMIERRFDHMMDEMKNMMKGVTEQSNCSGRDNRGRRSNHGGRGNRGGTEMVKKTSNEPFSVFCGHCKGSGHHYYDCPDLLQELRRIDEEARLNRESAREKDLVEATNEVITNTREDELKGDDYERMVEDNKPNFMEKVEENESELAEKEKHSVVLNTSLEDDPAPILPRVISVCEAVVSMPEHLFVDPFATIIDAYPTDTFYSYIVVSQGVIHESIPPKEHCDIACMAYDSSTKHAIGFLLSIRLMFDLEVRLVPHCVSLRLACADAFYDVLLIRGRILSNPEGMM